MFHGLKVGGLAVAFVLATGGTSSAQTTLRYKFKEGDTLDYVSENKTKMSTDLGGVKIAFNIKQYTNMTWKVYKVKADGSAEMGLKIDRIVMDVDGPPPLGAFGIDSNDKKDPDNLLAQQFARLLRKMAGQEIKTTMTPLGELKDVVYPEDLDRTLRDLGQGLGLGGGGGAGGLEQFTGGGLVVTKDALKKGDSWVHKSGGDGPKLEMKYTYEGTSGHLEKIAVKPKLLIEGAKAGLTIKSDDKKSMGVLLFDNQDGRLQDAQVTQVMSITVEMMGITIPMNVETTTHLKLKSGKK